MRYTRRKGIYCENRVHVVDLHLKIHSVNFFIIPILCDQLQPWNVFIRKVTSPYVISLLVPYLWTLINGKLARPLNSESISIDKVSIIIYVFRGNRAQNLNYYLILLSNAIFIPEECSWLTITWYLIVIIHSIAILTFAVLCSMENNALKFYLIFRVNNDLFIFDGFLSLMSI